MAACKPSLPVINTIYSTSYPGNAYHSFQVILLDSNNAIYSIGFQSCNTYNCEWRISGDALYLISAQLDSVNLQSNRQNKVSNDPVGMCFRLIRRKDVTVLKPVTPYETLDEYGSGYLFPTYANASVFLKEIGYDIE